MTSRTSAPQAPEFSPLSLVRMFWKRKLPILAGWLLLSAAAAVVVWKLPPHYMADALILIDSQKIPERFVASTVSTPVQERITAISQQIMSSTRLKSVIDEFNLYREYKNTAAPEEILEMMRADIKITTEQTRGMAAAKGHLGASRARYRRTASEDIPGDVKMSSSTSQRCARTCASSCSSRFAATSGSSPGSSSSPAGGSHSSCRTGWRYCRSRRTPSWP